MIVHELVATPTCAACDSTNTALVTGRAIYPRRKDLHHLYFWQCQDCAAYVGCYPNTQTPLGTPADAQLRRLRRQCHKALDALWLDSPTTTRSDAYDMMRTHTGVTHIGSTTAEDCERVLAWLDSL